MDSNKNELCDRASGSQRQHDDDLHQLKENLQQVLHHMHQHLQIRSSTSTTASLPSMVTEPRNFVIKTSASPRPERDIEIITLDSDTEVKQENMLDRSTLDLAQDLLFQPREIWPHCGTAQPSSSRQSPSTSWPTRQSDIPLRPALQMLNQPSTSTDKPSSRSSKKPLSAQKPGPKSSKALSVKKTPARPSHQDHDYFYVPRKRYKDNSQFAPNIALEETTYIDYVKKPRKCKRKDTYFIESSSSENNSNEPTDRKNYIKEDPSDRSYNETRQSEYSYDQERAVHPQIRSSTLKAASLSSMVTEPRNFVIKTSASPRPERDIEIITLDSDTEVKQENMSDRSTLKLMTQDLNFQSRVLIEKLKDTSQKLSAQTKPKQETRLVALFRRREELDKLIQAVEQKLMLKIPDKPCIKEEIQ